MLADGEVERKEEEGRGVIIVGLIIGLITGTYRSRRRQKNDGGRPHEHRGPHVDTSRIPRCLHATGASRVTAEARM